MRTKNDIVEIKEDVRVPGTDVILEAGDKIEILGERSNDYMNQAASDIENHYSGNVVMWLLQFPSLWIKKN